MAVISEYPLHNTGQEVQTAIDDALDTLPRQVALKANTADVLTKTNTEVYTPTADYHPSTKKYVDDNLPTVDVGQTTTGAEGTDAIVVNSGTPRHPILDFTIPRGNTGAAAGFATPTATATTLTPGSSATASVTASGEATSKLFAFTFGIPQGLQGIQGEQGYYVDKVEKTSGTGAAGTTDTYTMYLNDDNETVAGTFSVYNGADGQGAGTVTSIGITNSDNSLSVSGSPVTSQGNISVGHTNSITAQQTMGVYPIKIDASGHITEYGTVAENGLMYKNVYDTNSNGIVDGAESLHNSEDQIWFELS